MSTPAITPADQQAAALAAQGAILQLPDAGLDFLVGYWSRVDAHRSFWFEAGGTDQHHAHLLDYDEAIAHPLAVEFRQGGALVAWLTTIAESDLPDTADLKARFTAWQKELAQPNVRDFIEQQRAWHSRE